MLPTPNRQHLHCTALHCTCALSIAVSCIGRHKPCRHTSGPVHLGMSRPVAYTGRCIPSCSIIGLVVATSLALAFALALALTLSEYSLQCVIPPGGGGDIAQSGASTAAYLVAFVIWRLGDQIAPADQSHCPPLFSPVFSVGNPPCARCCPTSGCLSPVSRLSAKCHRLDH